MRTPKTLSVGTLSKKPVTTLPNLLDWVSVESYRQDHDTNNDVIIKRLCLVPTRGVPGSIGLWASLFELQQCKNNLCLVFVPRTERGIYFKKKNKLQSESRTVVRKMIACRTVNDDGCITKRRDLIQKDFFDERNREAKYFSESRAI